jgi:cell wall-associated NlpC family hydrolase
MGFTFADMPVSGRILADTRGNHPEKDRMVKQLKYLVISAFIFSSCSSLKTLTSGNNNKDNNSSGISSNTAKTSSSEKREVKFLDNISSSPAGSKTIPVETEKRITAPVVKNEPTVKPSAASSRPNAVEVASSLQLKYAILLNTEVENVPNTDLLKKIDEWYGTKYCMGGTTSKCIDCSAFMQILFASVYGISLPRTAREQYKVSSKISRTELKEGDMVFFNTRGGVSHVGFYLQNNKFVHASTGGVTISDLFDPYYLRRFVGVGRVEKTGIAKH